ncbi:hypothetical protein BJ912DRAFT_1061312 [Pholiota molesta]|nr:hypothetical protein BJ912DRAFT_1061312 [Pholiota molesta]
MNSCHQTLTALTLPFPLPALREQPLVFCISLLRGLQILACPSISLFPSVLHLSVIPRRRPFRPPAPFRRQTARDSHPRPQPMANGVCTVADDGHGNPSLAAHDDHRTRLYDEAIKYYLIG